MQLKGLVKFFTAALIIFSLWRLSFTFIAHNVDAKYNAIAVKQVKQQHPEATGTAKAELIDKTFAHITDSLRDETAFSFLGAKYSYQELKSKELALGLDLQGGMSVTLEVGLDGLLQSMAMNPKDPALLKTIEVANQMHEKNPENYITLFGRAYNQVNPGGRLAGMFAKPNQSKITSNSTNEEVLKYIKEEATQATERTYKVLETRIDKFGATQPTITLDKDKGIINVELAGVKNPESVRNTLQATAKLQFWEVYTNRELVESVFKADEALKGYLNGGKTTTDTTKTSTDSSKAVAKNDTAKAKDGSLTSLLNDTSKAVAGTKANAKTEVSLFTYMSPMVTKEGQAADASVIGIIERKNKEKVLELLNMDVVKNQFPANVKFLLGENPFAKASTKKDKNQTLGVYAIKTLPGTDDAKLEGDRVKDAKFDFQQNGQAEISLEFDPQGSTIWAKMTKDNVGHPIAITLDNYVYSAPNVINEISGGRSSITGSFDATSGTELANILKTGKLPAPAKIVQEQIVGPTLGAESIDGGLKSFAVSFLVIFILMIIYYNTAGIIANIALLLNMLFTFGLLAEFGATLTMAGIAGIVLGIGMAVDANVIIFERIKDELALGDTYAEAVDKGYKRSYAPILDGHVTSLITAVILLVFGMGAIRFFAFTQIIALVLSLFTGIMVSRLITDAYTQKGRHFKYFTKLSEKIFHKANFKFIEKRKITYVISAIIICLGIASFFHGFDYGVEFDGGRSYTIKFDQPYKTELVREKLTAHLGKHPVVKTIGTNNQLNITTDYLVNLQGKDAENKVLTKLYDGLKAEKFVPANVDLATFSTQYVQSTQAVSPTISEDLKKGAIKASIIAVIAIFLYIFIRFRKWQYSIGTIVSLIHDAAVTLVVFSFAKDLVPFALEIDQHFIAALLTVIGFSMNDTVIVFDRIRETFRKTPNADKTTVINRAINDTLSRTIMTSLTVFLTAVILFIFGGEVLRGFAFAMSIGVLVGTYSSIFLAAPVLVDMDKSDSLRVEEDKEERIKNLKTKA
ncbi:protein translocase subunit SecDF [Taibaiella sp. KBW10]|uniref:protein translocase subunit SecDF n=1 Tax=Taibaiella sp. KBW10 TaxID=2153357 RepID=UPI000F5A5385|nr:protein translocase subunit SecDF [Taibaiella sp. KBW10]RQO32115.1 protein translocase subunit SecDF [Taibaiella sp. KBW10]